MLSVLIILIVIDSILQLFLFIKCYCGSRVFYKLCVVFIKVNKSDWLIISGLPDYLV